MKKTLSVLLTALMISGTMTFAKVPERKISYLKVHKGYEISALKGGPEITDPDPWE